MPLVVMLLLCEMQWEVSNLFVGYVEHILAMSRDIGKGRQQGHL